MVNTFHRPAFFLDRWIPKLATHRNHRKLLLLDGATAYVGSRNIQDKYFFDWHDADVRITGPVLADLTEAFHGNQRNIGLHKQKPLYVAPDLPEKALRDTMSGLEQFFDIPVQVWNSSSTFLSRSFRNTRRTSGCPPETASNGP